jgi:hypothetical protein
MERNEQEIAKRARVYRETLERKYAALVESLRKDETQTEIRRDTYLLAGISDELAKARWIVGDMDCPITGTRG